MINPTQLNDDFEEIKFIQKKWRNQNHTQEKQNHPKKFQLTFDETNIDFQFPDVFITTRQFHNKQSKTPKQKKQDGFSLELSNYSVRQSKQQRRLELQQLETNYKKFKSINCSVQSSPRKNLLSKSLYTTRNKENFIIDGIKFPFELYSIHRKRREKLTDLYENQTSENCQLKITQIEEEHLQQIMQQQQKSKKKEYISRSFLDNAYFSILSANRICKSRIRTVMKQVLPKESRFQC